MASRAQRVRLALFLLTSTVVLLGFLIVVAGSHLWQERDTYYVHFDESVGGLAAGGLVKYQGITIGRVEETSISPERLGTVVVEISVDHKKAPNVIRQDTRARLYTQGLTGIKFVELVAGASDAPVLPPGSVIETGETFMSSLDERAQVLTEKVERLIDNLTQLTGPDNSRKLNLALDSGSRLMSSADELLEENRQYLDQSLRNMSQVTASLAASSASLEATMDSLRLMLTSAETHAMLRDLQVATHQVRLQLEGPVPRLLTNLTRMVGNIDTTAIHIDRTVLQSRRNILAAMQNLEETLVNVRQATELIREDPSVLIRGRAEEK
ncbi:MAG: MlaD family protein [Gemmatimonadota bacterium]